MTGLPSRTIPVTAEALVSQLEADILSWEPGSRLPPERKLAESFGVSRPVVREALRGLQERGLIAVHPGRGSFVKDVEPTRGGTSVDLLLRRGGIMVRELIEARRMLEAESAALAAEHHTDADAARLREVLDVFTGSTDVEERASLDVAFHEAIVVASHNTVLMIMFGSIRELIHGMVLRSLTDRATQQAGLPLHDRVLRAILSRDPRAARQAMTRHLLLAVEHYGPDADRPLADVLRRRADYQPEVRALLQRASRAVDARAAD